MPLPSGGASNFIAQYYYTKTELNAGQLDTLYFGEDEFINTSAGAGDAGKPIKLDASGLIASNMLSGGTVATHAALTEAHGATGAVVGTTNTQTLTNKTLTAPIISSISNTGTLTLPTSSDTLVGRATTDTLTNKTLTSPTLTGATTDTLVASTSVTGPTVYGSTAANGDITIHGTSDATRTSSYVLLQPTAGYVGVGTSTPSSELHIAGAGTGGTNFNVESTDTGGARYYFSSSGSASAPGAGYLEISKAGQASPNRMVYDGTNVRLGIGVANPSTALHVAGTATITTVTATNATVGGANVTTVSNTQTLTNKTLTSPALTGATTNTLVASASVTAPTVYGSSAADGDITIEGTSHATKTSSYVILQSTAGNVGIGTTTPDYLFEAGAGNYTLAFSPNFSASGNNYVISTLSGSLNPMVLYGSKVIVGADHININASKTPASASATGTAGDIAFDTSYIYVCTATDTWKRVAIATW